MVAMTETVPVDIFVIQQKRMKELSYVERGILSLAWGYASEKHADQIRRGNKQKYITHPVACAHVALELMHHVNQMVDDATHRFITIYTVAAIILHDVIEDSDATAEEIIELFGEQDGHGPLIAARVRALSKNKALPASEYWAQLRAAATTMPDVIIDKMIDRWHNLVSRYDEETSDQAKKARSLEKETAMLLETIGDFRQMCLESRQHVPTYFLPTFDEILNRILDLAHTRLAELATAPAT